jgi:hypothetical protein
MSEQYNIKVSEDGLVSATPIPTEQERESKLDEIIKRIDDPDTPLAPIKRLIAVEIATVSRLMIHFGNDITLLEGLKIKALDSQVKALRELGKELMESDVLSKKDFLNFEGAKLAFVLDEYRQGATAALKKMNIDDTAIQGFLRLWRDLMLEREPAIRRAVEKVDGIVQDKKEIKVVGEQ